MYPGKKTYEKHAPQVRYFMKQNAPQARLMKQNAPHDRLLNEALMSTLSY